MTEVYRCRMNTNNRKSPNAPTAKLAILNVFQTPVDQAVPERWGAADDNKI